MELPVHIEPFVNTWLGRYGRQYPETQLQPRREVFVVIQHMLRLTLSDPEGGLVGGYTVTLS